jgi:alpha-N-arabinofuranosidase
MTVKKTILLTLILSFGLTSFGQTTVEMLVDAGAAQYTINRHIYGHFSEHLGRCIYDGYWVDPAMNVPKDGRIRLDVVAALRQIKIPNLRWPGGCFADEYHWMDGIGPASQRPTMINTHWGNVTEDNSFGTHEFLKLCNLLETEPFIVGNLGSGSPQEMMQWVEYLNFDGVSPMTNLRKQNGRDVPWGVTYFGVGNENWGCGGNMTPEYYVTQYRRYATYVKNYPGSPVRKIACGPNGADYNWTEVLMAGITRGGRAASAWGIDFHYYTRPPGRGTETASATSFTEATYFATMRNALRMEELVRGHSAIMDKYDPQKNVSLVVGEWGIWTNVEPGTNPGFLYQQNSLRDALIAGSTLNIFNNHCDRVQMAQLAQTVNVLQAVILTEKEKMILTPTYHVFDLYKVHHDAKMLPVKFASPNYVLDKESLPALNVSASQDSLGVVHISLVNIDPKNSIPISLSFNQVKWSNVTGQVLTSANITDHNTFDKPETVVIKRFDGAKKQGNAVNINMPAKSIVVLELK